MKSKKVIVLLISLTLLVSMTLPGTVAASVDQAADSGHRTGMPENEEKDTSPEGAGDPDSSGANQSEAPPVPSGAAQSEDSSGSSGPDQSGDSSGSSGLDQSADPSQPEEPGNTGGQDTCNCGYEDGTHAEDCPMYVAPEGLEEEEEQEESSGASLTVFVQVSGEDQGNAVLNLTGPEGYCKRIVVHGGDSVTLSGLGAGEYTVSDGEVSQSVTLEAGGSNRVDITVTRSSHGWLTGEAYQTFTFNS